MANKQNRRNFGRTENNLPELDLSLVQRQSWDWFLKEGISEELTNISPVEDFAGKNWELSFGKHTLEASQVTPKEAREKGITYSTPFKVETTLTNKRTGASVTQEVFFGNIPQMTTVGTFIINGIERTVINQIVRSPGAYFSGTLDAASGRMLYKAEIRPLHHGSWLEFETGRNDVISARIDRRRKVNAATILRALGIYSNDEITRIFADVNKDGNHNYVQKTIEKDPTRTREDALLEIYKKLRPGEPALLDNAETLFHNLFFDNRHYDLGKVGRYKINKRLGLNVENNKQNWVLTKDDIVQTLHYLIGLQNGIGRVDDIDHLSNRRLRCVGELVATHAFRTGLLRLERSIKEKMSLVSQEEKPNPSALINARPLIASLNEFFRSNQLSTILDNTNPLSEIDNLRRVSVLGPGGINRERASFSIRDVNPSQYGRIDPVRSPEGMNIGLVTYLTLYARVNEFGFIETPYKKVDNRKITNEIVYLTADDEEKYYITHNGINIDDSGKITDDRVAIRYAGNFTEGSSKLVQYIDLTPRQVFGASASLIPFLDHDEGNRALMGSNMQCQAVPLVAPSSPVVGTGMEATVASSMGRVVKAEYPGTVSFVDADKIEIKLDKQSLSAKADKKLPDDAVLSRDGKTITYYLTKFWRTSQSTCYNQKAKVVLGQKLNPGDLIIDGPATEDGELALGQNLVVAYASISGYGFEDAILISDRIVKDDLLTSINIREYTADVVETKLGPEVVTKDIPNVSEDQLANLASDGIVVVGAEVHPNDILVGKIAPKGEMELTAEERLLRAIFGEKAREVRDTSLRVPHGEEGIVIDVQVLSKEKGDELAPGVISSVIVKVAQLRKVTVGDKIAGRHGNKGVISKIMPEADMPYLPDGTPVDLVISPLSVLARMNLGQLLECHLGWALDKNHSKASVPVFDKIPESKIHDELKEAGLPVSGKTRLIDGRTGEALSEDTVVGIGYIMKLKHMIEDKTHARSTGPYSLVTQQPLGGKAQMGGQRLGEMEVWALEAHRAAHTLQEMLTIKSDDIVGRAAAFGAIVKGQEIPEAKIPESFKVLVRELNALGLAIDVDGTMAAVTEEHTTDDGVVIQEKKQPVTDPLLKLRELEDLKSLQIKLASEGEIRSWSRGEVTKPETINYRTLKPEKDGLFDERIFGPTRDWECYCGKYKRIRYKGVICDKCGVEVTESRVRRERMGHIALAAPVVHVWFFKGAPSKVSLLLDLPPRAIEQVVYFARYIVMSVDDKKRKEAIDVLIKTREEKIKETREISAERRELIKQDGEDRKGKIANRIKDKEQAALAISEVDLDVRKKETTLVEEEKATIEKTTELFDRMTDLVKKISPFGFLSEDEYDQLSTYDVSDFLEVKMGAEALLIALSKLNLDELSKSLRAELEGLQGKGARYLKVAKRLKLIDGLREAKVSPTSVILKVIPILPPDLRPMVQLAGGRFATSDLNDLYRRVINRNNRLKHLIGLGAPDIILRNEKRMLQEAVDSLIDASQRKAMRRGRGRLALRSLSDMLKGKQGRFRANLLGKRVDYSGRSVIIVGPELNLNQCGLPKEMALEMFKPFVLREVIKREIAPNVKSAKNLLERRPPEVFDILEEITKDHPVLLNRAPTLHKLGILAFYPVLIEGSAIRLHPAVCSGFGADFDGDQMAVHVPLSKKAIEEAKTLMMSDKNLLKTSDGSPVATPASKEMALGVYYFTSLDTRMKASETIFADKAEAIFAYQIGKVALRQQIKVKVDNEVNETTVGRILFNEILPEGFRFVNENVSSGIIKDLVTEAYTKVSQERLVKLIDDIKNLGFVGGTISGLSFAVSDAAIFEGKAKIIKEADKKVDEIEKSFHQGLITNEEKKRSIQQIWIETTEEIADKTWNVIPADSPIRTVIDAKVGRTSRDQIKQLGGMRGLVVDPLGKIVELPVKSNFREGLSVFEYVASGRGSRKGLTDTALKTADAGYLTRRLVDVTHDVLIREEDCGTKDGILIKKSVRGGSFYKRIFGRFDTNGELIDEKRAKELADDANVTEFVVRSPLTCKTRFGVCQKCYGWDLSNKQVVELGMPIGVIAAQSIGEPGTQLTLRTKHSGGVVGADVTQGLPRVEELFESRIPKTVSPISEIAGKVSIKESEDGNVVKVTSVNTKPKEEREYIIAKTNKISVEDGQLIDAGTQLASGYLDIKEILQVRGLGAAQEYLVNELQAVYESQGISINDRHFEIIVRKMCDTVRILTSGDSRFLPEELTDKSTFEEEVEKVIASGGEAATARQIILGVTKRALYTNSWLSSASFEQTTDVLAESALEGSKDRLLGLKENVIIGRLIPIDPKRAALHGQAEPAAV
ncbi:MAG TPA: DNA-directed RNA polymerase subunit beta' [Patescibacteria group bacterium]|nr:DNA-directed RNA polymerase subunit beta' [Patescibacteria group bacterium]